MYVTPRPKQQDDPYFAIRIGLACAGGFLAVAIIEPVMASIFIIFPFMLLSNQRKAINVKDTILAFIAMVAMVFVCGMILAITRPVPIAMVAVVATLVFIGFYEIRRTGSSVMKILIIAISLLSIMAMKKYYLLHFIAMDMVGALFIAVVISIFTYAIIPPRAKDYFVKKPVAPSGNEFGGAIIRTIVTMCALYWLYTFIEYQDMYLVLATIYPLTFPTYRESIAEAVERILATFLGILGAAILYFGASFIDGSFPMVAMMIFMLTSFWGYWMMHGRSSMLVYQYAIVVSMSVFMHGMYSGDQLGFTMMRVNMTMVGAVSATLAIILLDRIFLKPIKQVGPSRHPAVQRYDLGRELD